MAANTATKRAGKVLLTRKFVDGMERYVSLWGNRVAAFLEESSEVSDDLGMEAFDPTQLSFDVEIGPFEGSEFFRRVGRFAVVNAGLTHRSHTLAAVLPRCRVAWTTELTLSTRLQIIRAEEADARVRLRRAAWDTRQEWRNTRAVAAAAGVQCNGVPTFKVYAPISRSPLLYFDTRLAADALPSSEELEERLQTVRGGSPLRLVYTGRLIRIKGVDHLPLLARELQERRVPFELDVFGAGDLESDVRRAVESHGLESKVRIRGALDFSAELFPRLKRDYDVFVCCHRQGDPSCTYLETFGAGIPIVGYDNEAFTGLLERTSAGLSVPMGDVDHLADVVEGWHRNRDRVVAASRAALEFAREHTFETTFQRRIDHMKALPAEPHASTTGRKIFAFLNSVAPATRVGLVDEIARIAKERRGDDALRR